MNADAVERLDDTARPTDGEAAARRKVLLQSDALEHHRGGAPAPTATQQCATWPFFTDTAGGYSVSHCGSRVRSGGWPPISTSRSCLRSTSGRQRKRARV